MGRSKVVCVLGSFLLVSFLTGFTGKTGFKPSAWSLSVGAADAALSRNAVRPERLEKNDRVRKRLEEIRVANEKKRKKNDIEKQDGISLGSARWFERNASNGCLFMTCGYDFLSGRTLRGTGETFDIPFEWRPEMAERFGLLVVFAVELSPWSKRVTGANYDEDYPRMYLVDDTGAVLGYIGENADSPESPNKADYRVFDSRYGDRLLPLHLDVSTRMAAIRSAKKSPRFRIRVETDPDAWSAILPKNARWGVSVWSLSPERQGILTTPESCKKIQKDIAEMRRIHALRADILEEASMRSLAIDLIKKGRQEFVDMVLEPEYVQKLLPVERIMNGEYILEATDTRVVLKRVAGNGQKEIIVNELSASRKTLDDKGKNRPSRSAPEKRKVRSR